MWVIQYFMGKQYQILNINLQTENPTNRQSKGICGINVMLIYLHCQLLFGINNILHRGDEELKTHVEIAR